MNKGREPRLASGTPVDFEFIALVHREPRRQNTIGGRLAQRYPHRFSAINLARARHARAWPGMTQGDRLLLGLGQECSLHFLVGRATSGRSL